MIYMKQAPIASFPAYVVCEREADRSGFVNITAADRLGLDSGRGFYREYMPGSVVSYALQYNEDPIAAVERAKGRKELLHWINACGSVLTDHKQEQRTLVAVRIGMRVRFEGLQATIQPDHNNNLRLVSIVEKAAA